MIIESLPNICGPAHVEPVGSGRGAGLAAARLRWAQPAMADGNEQDYAVEQGLDEERAPELLDPGDADGEDCDTDHRTLNIDPPRLDGGGAQKGAHQGWQKIFEPDACLADPEFGGQQYAG